MKRPTIKTLIAALLLPLCSALATPLQLRWTAEMSDPKPYNAVLFAGESADLQATLKLYGRSVALEDTATASLYWQTNGMGSAWWQSPATVTTAGVVTASWTPAMDAGADLYRWHLGVANAASSTIYRAFGAFKMQGGPGAVPNEIPIPPRVIDFDAVTVTNAPWVGRDELEELVGDIGAGVVEEADPLAAAWQAAHLAADNPHSVTAAQVGALPLAGGTLDYGASIKGGGLLGAFSLGGGHPYLLFRNSPTLYASLDCSELIFNGGGRNLRYTGDGIEFVAGGGSAIWSGFRAPGEYQFAALSDVAAAEAELETQIAEAVDGIWSLQNAFLVVSNNVASITRNGETLWSSAGGSGGVPAAATNALWQSVRALEGEVASLQAQLAAQPRSWGDYAPDGSDNPDPDHMLWINRPATVFAAGYQWATSGGHAAVCSTGAVAFAAGDSGELRIGPAGGGGYFGFSTGGSVEVGCMAGGISVADDVASITYPYDTGGFPTLWFTPDLGAVAWERMEGVVWIDNGDGTATVSAPATTQRGFWKATTSVSYDAAFLSTMPAKFTAGVFGSTNSPPVIYDSTITIQSGKKTYRIPAEEL